MALLGKDLGDNKKNVEMQENDVYKHPRIENRLLVPAYNLIYIFFLLFY